MKPQEAVRLHRHDVLNHLQLVKGYLQLQRPEKALAALDRCVDWLASLSSLQSQCGETWTDVLWETLGCPHLRVAIHPTDASLGLDETHVVSDALRWLEQAAVVHNMEKLTVVLKVDGEKLLAELTFDEVPPGLVLDSFRVELASTFPAVRWCVHPTFTEDATLKG